MFKKFTKVLMIILLAISLSVALGNEAKSAFYPYAGKFTCTNPVCFDCLLKGLGNAIGAGSVLYFNIDSVDVEIQCNNGGDQNTTGIGVPHSLLLNFGIAQEVTKEDVLKNGVAYVMVCYEEDDFDALVEAKLQEASDANLICEKNNWYWSQEEEVILTQYYATVIFEMDDENRWVLEIRVWPDGEGCYDYEVLSEVVVRK